MIGDQAAHPTKYSGAQSRTRVTQPLESGRKWLILITFRAKPTSLLLPWRLFAAPLPPFIRAQEGGRREVRDAVQMML